MDEGAAQCQQIRPRAKKHNAPQKDPQDKAARPHFSKQTASSQVQNFRSYSQVFG